MPSASCPPFEFDLPAAWARQAAGAQVTFTGPDGQALILRASGLSEGGKPIPPEHRQNDAYRQAFGRLKETNLEAGRRALDYPDLLLVQPFTRGEDRNGLELSSGVATTLDPGVRFFVLVAVAPAQAVLFGTYEGPDRPESTSNWERFMQSLCAR